MLTVIQPHTLMFGINIFGKQEKEFQYEEYWATGGISHCFTTLTPSAKLE